MAEPGFDLWSRDPGPWLLDSGLLSGLCLWKEIYEEKFINRQVRGSLTPKWFPGSHFTSLGWFPSQKPFCGFPLSPLSTSPMRTCTLTSRSHCLSWFQIHWKKHRHWAWPVFCLPDLHCECLWEIASVLWLHIGLLLVSRVIMTLLTQLWTRSQESWF